MTGADPDSTSDQGADQDLDRKAQQKEESEIFPAIDGEEQEEPSLMPIQPFIGRQDETPESRKQTFRIEIPTYTIIKVIATLVVIWLALRVASVFLLLLLAVILCLALLPVVKRLEHRGLPRGAAVAVVFAGLVGIFVGFGWLVVPPLVDQTQRLIDDFPEYVENFDSVLDRYPDVRDAILGPEDESGTEGNDAAASSGTGVDAGAVQAGATTALSVVSSIVGGVANTFFVVVLALYLLVEGERTFQYFARYMTPTLRYRFRRLGPQLTQVVSGYVLGQAIISTTFGVYSFIVLSALGVPQPLLLALFSGLSSAIPIVGVPVATVAAMAIALSVD